MGIELNDIIEIALQNENIRGLTLYGSRANPEIEPDPFQDYDLYCIVRDVETFDPAIFGTPILEFTPSENYPELFPEQFVHLMLFEDGGRIDLTVCQLDSFLRDLETHPLMKCLMDKDGTLHIPNETDLPHSTISPMDESVFQKTCAEFFWEVQNMVKGLVRDELSYAMFIRDISLRDMLNRFIDQHIAINNDYSVSVGTLGKYRKKYMSANEFEMYERTYWSNSVSDRWASLLSMIDLFSYLGKRIAAAYGYGYPNQTENVVRKYVAQFFV